MALPMQTPTPNPKPRRPPAGDPNAQGGQDGEMDPMLEALRGGGGQPPQQTATPPDTLPMGEPGGGIPAQPRRTPDAPAPSTGAYLPPAPASPYTPTPAPQQDYGPIVSANSQAQGQGAQQPQQSQPSPLPPASPQIIDKGIGNANANVNVGGEGNYPDFSQPGLIEQWWQDHGVTLRPGAADYWRSKWQEYGARDPEFFGRKLNEALQSGSELGNTDSTPGAQGSISGSMGGHGNDWQSDPSIHDAILRLLKRGETPVSGDDPAIRAQFNPQSQVLQRGAARSRAGAAERAFAQGQTGEGTMDTSVNAINQDTGMAEAGLMGKLIGDELTARRQDVLAAMSAANDQDRMSLQAYLSRIDAELRKYGIDVNNQQYYDDLGYRIGRDTYTFNQY